MQHWFILILAGLFEVVWTLSTKMSDGYTKLLPSIVTVVAMILSGYCLAIAAKNIPLSVAYAVWVGIGVVGTFLGSVYLFAEKITPLSILFLFMVFIGIIGLKLSVNNA